MNKCILDKANIKQVITHAKCPDGIASALLARVCFPNAEVHFLSYDTNKHRDLEPAPGMLFVDFSPHRSRVQEFVDAGALVLDHHKTARDVVEQFGDRGVYGDEQTEPGVCGAVLVLREVMRVLEPEEARRYTAFAEIMGVRDTWQRNHPEWDLACEQAAALIFWGFDRLVERARPDTLYDEPGYDACDDLHDALAIGRVLHEKRIVRAKALGDVCFRTSFWHRGSLVHAAIVPDTEHISDVAEYVGEDVAVVAGFAYAFEDGQPILQVSLRSHTTFDCEALAARHGGGGHTRAAGFVLRVTQQSANPFTQIDYLLRGA